MGSAPPSEAHSLRWSIADLKALIFIFFPSPFPPKFVSTALCFQQFIARYSTLLALPHSATLTIISNPSTKMPETTSKTTLWIGWALVGKFLNSFPLFFFSSYMQRERKFPSIYNNWNCFWTNDIRRCVFVSRQADLHEKMEGRNESSSLFVHRKQNLVPTHIANEVDEQGDLCSFESIFFFLLWTPC